MCSLGLISLKRFYQTSVKKYITLKTFIGTIFTEEVVSAGLHHALNTQAFQSAKMDAISNLCRLQAGEMDPLIFKAKLYCLAACQYEVNHPKGALTSFLINTKYTVGHELTGEVTPTLKEGFVNKKTDLMLEALTNSSDLLGNPSSTELVDLALSLVI